METLGQGAIAPVYRACDLQLDRFVALKVPTFGAHDSQKIQRFVAKAAASEQSVVRGGQPLRRNFGLYWRHAKCQNDSESSTEAFPTFPQ